MKKVELIGPILLILGLYLLFILGDIFFWGEGIVIVPFLIMIIGGIVDVVENKGWKEKLKVLAIMLFIIYFAGIPLSWKFNHKEESSKRILKSFTWNIL